MTARQVKIIEGGKLIIPASMRRELGIARGDTVLIHVEQGELRVRSLGKAVERAQAIVRHRIAAPVSLAEELVAERRGEAAPD
jgi:bifunctional DNA-binding transcriptional regulator/antitoxin component of YhaV-PrlF toxin-antitoxin module